jgi:hypothetical protein
MGSSPSMFVLWSLGELCCWVHKLLAGSPKPDRSNVKGQMVPHVAGGGGVKNAANNLALYNNMDKQT